MKPLQVNPKQETPIPCDTISLLCSRGCSLSLIETREFICFAVLVVWMEIHGELVMHITWSMKLSILLNVMFHAQMGRFQLELIYYFTCYQFDSWVNVDPDIFLNEVKENFLKIFLVIWSITYMLSRYLPATFAYTQSRLENSFLGFWVQCFSSLASSEAVSWESISVWNRRTAIRSLDQGKAVGSGRSNIRLIMEAVSIPYNHIHAPAFSQEEFWTIWFIPPELTHQHQVVEAPRLH